MCTENGKVNQSQCTLIFTPCVSTNGTWHCVGVRLYVFLLCCWNALVKLDVEYCPQRTGSLLNIAFWLWMREFNDVSPLLKKYVFYPTYLYFMLVVVSIRMCCYLCMFLFIFLSSWWENSHYKRTLDSVCIGQDAALN